MWSIPFPCGGYGLRRRDEHQQRSPPVDTFFGRHPSLCITRGYPTHGQRSTLTGMVPDGPTPLLCSHRSSWRSHSHRQFRNVGKACLGHGHRLARGSRPESRHKGWKPSGFFLERDGEASCFNALQYGRGLILLFCLLFIAVRCTLTSHGRCSRGGNASGDAQRSHQVRIFTWILSMSLHCIYLSPSGDGNQAGMFARLAGFLSGTATSTPGRLSSGRFHVPLCPSQLPNMVFTGKFIGPITSKMKGRHRIR